MGLRWEETSWAGKATPEEQVRSTWVFTGLSPLPGGFCHPWWGMEIRKVGVLRGGHFFRAMFGG